MGYQVYEDPEGQDRWAGYIVPAECDYADCTTKINRGLSYKCEEHGYYLLMLNGESIDYSRFEDEPDAEEEWVEAEGCGLYFCGKHGANWAEHQGVKPKPDSIEWVQHMLNHESWEEWRKRNPGRTAAMRERVNS